MSEIIDENVSAVDKLADAYVADLLRDCDHWKRKALATQAQIDRDDRIAQGMSTEELVAEVKRARDTRGCLIGEVQQLKTIVANQRKELHSLNVERAKTLTKLEDVQRELRDANERMERLRLRGIEEDDSYDPYKRLCDIVDEECGLQPAKLPTGTMLSMLESAMFEWRKRCAELEAAFARVAESVGCVHEQSMGAAWSGSTDEVAGVCGRMVARIAELEERIAFLCDAWQYACESPPTNCECAGCSFARSVNAELDITPDCAPIAESPFPAAVALAHSVVSTTELSAFEIAAAGAADALSVDVDGLGFVKRAWLERHRASVAQQRELLAEPAERKPHEGRLYGSATWSATIADIEAYGGTVDKMVRDMAAHLRELLDERKAIEAIVVVESCHVACRVREALNGKR